MVTGDNESHQRNPSQFTFGWDSVKLGHYKYLIKRRFLQKNLKHFDNVIYLNSDLHIDDHRYFLFFLINNEMKLYRPKYH